MDPIRELLARLDTPGDLSDEDLTGLRDELRGAADERLDSDERTTEVVAELKEIADGLTKIEAEFEARTEAQAAIDAEVAEIEKSIRGEADDGDGDETPEPEGDAESTEPPAAESPEPEAPEADATEPAAEPEPEREPVTASAPAEPPRPSQRRTSSPSTTPKPKASEAPSTLRVFAAADNRRASAGAELDPGAVPDLMVDKIRALSGSSGRDGEHVPVATFEAQYPTERVVEPGASMAATMQTLDAAISEHGEQLAQVASGGLCAPLSPWYPLENISGTQRPVRDSLPSVNADRGGITFTAPPVLSSILVDQAGAAITVHTVADDLGGSAKTCQAVDCGSTTNVQIEAIVKCLSFGNMGARAYPEKVAQNDALAMSMHARTAEQQLLIAMGAASTAVTAAQSLGALRDWLNQVSKAAAAYRQRHRMVDDATLQVVAPRWLVALLVNDAASAMNAEVGFLDFTTSEVEQFLRSRNIAVTWATEGNDATQDFTGAQGAAALNEFPTTAEWLLFHPGAFVFLDGGTLDLGIVRDSTLNSTNDYQTFTETFEAVAFLGVESLLVTSTICPTGLTAGTADTSGLCSGS